MRDRGDDAEGFLIRVMEVGPLGQGILETKKRKTKDQNERR